MSCPRASQIDDRIDGTLGAEETRAFDLHLADCTECAALLEDLRAIAATARVLERHAPPAALWARIAGAVAAERPGRRVTVAPFGFEVWRPLAAAAMLTIVVGSVSWLGWQLVSAVPEATPEATATAEPDPALIQSVETQLKLAEEHYSNAIAGLDAIAKADDSALDAQTADILQTNLTVIDTAIGESRAALQADPSNTLAQESLFSALQSKVSLLQNTIALINEMRKGNDAGAARIVSGMNP